MRLEYKRGLIALVFVAFSAGAFWLWFGDDFSEGRYALKTIDGLTFRGVLTLLASLVVVVLVAPHMFNILLGRPLIEIKDSELLIWALPYERIPLSEIEKVLVGDQITEIHRHGDTCRKIRVSPSRQPRIFFFETLRGALGSRSVVDEK